MKAMRIIDNIFYWVIGSLAAIGMALVLLVTAIILSPFMLLDYILKTEK